MKGILSIILLCGLLQVAQAQAKEGSKANTKKQSTAKRSGTILVDSNSFTSNAVDSFKRTLRYSPGRPYALPKTPDTIAATNSPVPPGSSTQAERFTDPTTRRVKVTSEGINLTGTQPVQNIPISPSVERNKADINQLPMNQNRKNSISTMNSPQVNTLNNYQMAPPPENWGFAMEDNPWGRNTIGASQWTPDSKVYNNFLRDYPNAGNAKWSQSIRDSMATVVMYSIGDSWSTTMYNNQGLQTETRTNLSIYDLPEPVKVYMNKQNNDYKIQQLLRINRPLQGDEYLIVFNTGRRVYINNQGIELPSR